MTGSGPEHERTQHPEQENESLREDVTRVRSENDRLRQENTRLRETVDKLEKQLRRKARSASPFSKQKPKANPKRPWRKPGEGPFRRRETPAAAAATEPVDVLRNRRERIFRLNEEAFDLMGQFKVSKWVREKLRQMPVGQEWNEAEFSQRLADQLPYLSGAGRGKVMEAAAIAAHHAETGYPMVRLLVCDDAKQFKLVTDELALCWIHDGRHYQSLEPCVPQHRELLEAFRGKYWDYYRQLRAYQQAPTPEQAALLGEQFDGLFATVTGYDALDRRIEKTKANKEPLLMVLKHPEIPLHNNPAELGARRRVRKRVVSYGPRSEQGITGWDTLQTLFGTAKKLGVNCFQYIRDRISGTRQMPALADLIRQRAKTLNLGASWAPL